MTIYKLIMLIETEVKAEVEHLADMVDREAQAAVEPVEVLSWTIEDTSEEIGYESLLREAGVLK